MRRLEAWLSQLAQWLYGTLPDNVAAAIPWLLAALAILWLLRLLDALTGRTLTALAIRPRKFAGLRGIVFAPLLHSSFSHLWANSIPLLVLGLLVSFTGPGNLLLCTVVAWAGSGAGVWLTGAARTRHLGASGVIFGYLGFLFSLGLTQHSATAIALAAVALLLYGGIFWGLLPGREGKSWQGHLFGFLGGVAAASPWMLV